jgi:hypothetical protein
MEQTPLRMSVSFFGISFSWYGIAIFALFAFPAEWSCGDGWQTGMVIEVSSPVEPIREDDHET